MSTFCTLSKTSNVDQNSLKIYLNGWKKSKIFMFYELCSQIWKIYFKSSLTEEKKREFGLKQTIDNWKMTIDWLTDYWVTDKRNILVKNIWILWIELFFGFEIIWWKAKYIYFYKYLGFNCLSYKEDSIYRFHCVVVTVLLVVAILLLSHLNQTSQYSISRFVSSRLHFKDQPTTFNLCNVSVL